MKLKLLEYARDNEYAISAVNSTSSSTANACLEDARKNNSPVMIQVSNGSDFFLCVKVIKDPNAAAGFVALVVHVRAVTKHYEVPVILHSNHCAKEFFYGLMV